MYSTKMEPINVILTIGDPHFKTNNIPESEEMTLKLVELAKQVKPSLIVDLGDTLHRHETIHVSPLMRAEVMLRQLSEVASTVLIIGNHDRPNNSNFQTDEHPFNALKQWSNMKVVDKATSITVNGQTFLCAPYVPPGRFMEALNTIDPTNTNILQDVTCIFAHQEFKGAKMGAIVSHEGDVWPTDQPLVVSGHIHDYDKLQDNLIYTGTPMQHAFGDRSDKTVSIFRFYSDKTWTEERVDLGLVKREIVYLSPAQVHTFDINADIYINKLIKLIVKGTDAEIKAIIKLDKIKELKKNGTKIAYKTVSADEDNINKPDLQTLKMHYLARLHHEIRYDPNLTKWYRKLFSDSVIPIEPVKSVEPIKSTKPIVQLKPLQLRIKK